MKTNLAKEKYYTTEQHSIIEEVVGSLNLPQKQLSCKFFYDEKGSDLFEDIVAQDEYYLGRTEISIMNENIEEISRIIGEKSIVIEPGSGSGNKIRILLDKLIAPAAYVPIDISESYVKESANKLSNNYPSIRILPIIADYTNVFKLPDFNFDYEKLLVYYPGSTVGNFRPEEAKDFLAKIAHLCGKNNYLLIGVDLVKDKSILENAYNDKNGVTAEFNLNILTNLNNLVDSDFDTEKWAHRAFFNEKESRIEMHLESLEKQLVNIDGYTVTFDKGETIHTENSYKYRVGDFCDLLSDYYSLKKHWTDADSRFAVFLFESI